MDTESNKNLPSASTVDVNKEYVRTTGTKNTHMQSQMIVNRWSISSFYKLAPARAVSKPSAQSEGTSTDRYKTSSLTRQSWRCDPHYKTVPDWCMHCMPQKSLAPLVIKKRPTPGSSACTPCSQQWVFNGGDPLSRHGCCRDRLCSGCRNYCTADLANCDVRLFVNLTNIARSLGP